MKLPKSFTTVTTVSKTLFLCMMIVLPFGGFYLGMEYQKRITPLPSPEVKQATKTAIDTTTWKTYTNPIDSVTLLYPPSWTVAETHELSNRALDNPKEINTATLKGKEGEIVIQWGPMGFGGGCDEKDHKSFPIKNAVLQNICNSIGTDDVEYWSQLYNQTKVYGRATGIRATAYAPSAYTSPVIKTALESIAFNESAPSQK